MQFKTPYDEGCFEARLLILRQSQRKLLPESTSQTYPRFRKFSTYQSEWELRLATRLLVELAGEMAYMNYESQYSFEQLYHRGRIRQKVREACAHLLNLCEYLEIDPFYKPDFFITEGWL